MPSRQFSASPPPPPDVLLLEPPPPLSLLEPPLPPLPLLAVVPPSPELVEEAPVPPVPELPPELPSVVPMRERVHAAKVVARAMTSSRAEPGDRHRRRICQGRREIFEVQEQLVIPR